MAHQPGPQYRIVVEGAVSQHFRDAFPELEATRLEDGLVELRGPVTDPSQLAGIVSTICFRNSVIRRVELISAGPVPSSRRASGR